ncbi:MAG: FmdE family protein [Chloroflexota bacterium]
MNDRLQSVLQESAESHGHVCPRQVLGARMGLLAGDMLGVPLPQVGKRLMALVETDGCFADGIAAATGCTLGHRTMRLIDVGRVACIFVDLETERAVRIAPHPESREAAGAACPDAKSRWHGYLEAYQILPDDTLFIVQEVTLTLSVRALISRPDARVLCDECGEEIINEREINRDGQLLCRVCAGEMTYYTVQSTLKARGTTA